MPEPGVILWRGPSLLTGDPVVAVATGLEGGSMNPKTGAMVQVWILRPDMAPMAAVRANLDEAICGTCALRGRNGHNRRCYVSPWLGPNNVFKAIGSYIVADDDEIAALLEQRHVRIAAYGDPAAVPFAVWENTLRFAAGWTAYTHQWRTCDRRLQAIAMASVDSAQERQEAQRAGWRTFRVRPSVASIVQANEAICPASDEGGHKVTCAACELCRGTATAARSVVIVAHGHNGVMTAFHRSRRAAEAAV